MESSKGCQVWQERLLLSYLLLLVAKGRLGKHGLTVESSGCPGDKACREGTVTECFHCPVFVVKARLQESLSMEARVKVQENEDFLLVKDDQISYPSVKLAIQKSIDPNEMHPWVLRELAGITVKPSSTLHHLWRVMENRRSAWKYRLNVVLLESSSTEKDLWFLVGNRLNQEPAVCLSGMH